MSTFRSSSTTVVLAMLLVVALIAVLTTIWVQAVLDQLLAFAYPSFDLANAAGAGPSNAINTAAAGAGAAAGVGAAAGSAAGTATGAAAPAGNRPYDPSDPFADPADRTRAIHEARQQMDPRNSPGATEARQTYGGQQVGAPSHGAGQSYSPTRPTPSPTPPQTFGEALENDRGYQHYGPQAPPEGWWNWLTH